MTEPPKEFSGLQVKRAVFALSGIILALAGTAHADKADVMFKKAKKLLGEKRYPEACAAFEDVVKLDPKGIGGMLNAGKCYEDWGRLARAYDWYEKAAVIAADQKDEREAKIKQLVEELDTNVPRLTIKIPENPDLAVLATLTLDGRAVDQATLGTEVRVDPGPHVIEYTVSGSKKKKTAPVERGGSSEVTIDIPKAKAQPDGGTGDQTPEKPIVETPAQPGHGQRIAGIVVGGAGVVTLGVSGIVTLSARGKYKDALDAHCAGSSSMCDPAGLSTTHHERHIANIMTVTSIVGGAMVIGGVLLYLLAPDGAPAQDRTGEHALRITPVVSADGATVVLGGAF